MKRLLIAVILMLLISTGCQRMSQINYPSDWPEKKASASQCPDISGIYFDRVSRRYSSSDFSDSSDPAPLYGSQPRKDNLCIDHWGGRSVDFNYLRNSCSLWHWFGHVESYRSGYRDECATRKIEISQMHDLKIDLVFYEDNEVVNNLSINLDGKKYWCESGSVVLYERGKAEDSSYSKIEIFPTNDGSLITKAYSRGFAGVLPFFVPIIIPPGPVATLGLYQWQKVDSGESPYKDCH